MKKEDLISAVNELLRMKEIHDILPSCFTRRNIEGFKNNLEAKGQSSTKEGKLYFYFSKLILLCFVLQVEVFRLLLEFIKPNSEYDIFLVHKVLNIIIRMYI